MSSQRGTIAIVGAGVIGVSSAAACAVAGRRQRLNVIRDDFASVVGHDLRAMIASFALRAHLWHEGPREWR